jgi:hypothetical protein
MRSFIFLLNYAKTPPIPSGYPHRVPMDILMDKYQNCYRLHSIVIQIILFDWFGGCLRNCSPVLAIGYEVVPLEMFAELPHHDCLYDFTNDGH